MSAPPSAPQLLMPVNPSEDSFTKPMVNELRSESVSADANADSGNDGSEARGTFATSNQARQDQPSGFGPQLPSGQSFGSQSGSGSNFQAPQMDARGFGGSMNSGGPPPIRFESQSADRPPVNETPRVTSQPSEWRDAPPVAASGQSGQASQNPSVGASYIQNQSANNNLRTGSAQLQNNNSITPMYNQQAAMQPMMQPINRDNGVRPTNFTQPVPPRSTTDFAKTLMARYAIDNFSDGLPGEPVKLLDMLRQPISTQQRQSMVHQYWETYYDWASLVASQQYQEWLNRVPASGTSADKAILEAAQIVAANKVMAAEIQLGKSQAGLLQYMPNRRSSLLPLPNDLPLIQKYKTNYELYQSYQLMPTSLRGIDQMLPKTLELISQRAEAIRYAKNAADQVIAGLSNRQASIVSALEAGRIWRSAEQDLIASVTGYNQAIADYSMTVSQGYQSPEQVVAMLIAKPANANIRQATNINRQGQANRASGFDQFGRPTQSVVDSRFNNQTQNSNTPSGVSQNSFGGQRNTSGDQQQQQFSNANAAGGTSRFDLNAKRAFQSNNQNGTNRQLDNGQSQSSVSGAFIAPATPVGNPAASGGGRFGPQPPSQQPTGQGARSAQVPFGPATNGFGR